MLRNYRRQKQSSKRLSKARSIGRWCVLRKVQGIEVESGTCCCHRSKHNRPADASRSTNQMHAAPAIRISITSDLVTNLHSLC